MIKVVDLGQLADIADGSGAIWGYGGDDLNANLVSFEGDGGVEEHRNDEVDVLILGLSGEGRLTVEDTRSALSAGQLVVIPKGLRRSIHSAGGRFTYLTCHRRRAGLWPTMNTETIPNLDKIIDEQG